MLKTWSVYAVVKLVFSWYLNKAKCKLAHLYNDNINNLRDRDPPCQYPDEPARVPGARGHSPQEILGLQGNHRDPELRIRIRDPGSDAFLTPGSGIRNKFFSDPGSRISDPGSQTHIFETY
jgi:hypothetical protein